MKSTLIIDGHHLLYRSYAVPFSFYSKEKHIPLHVVTTFLKFVRTAVRKAQELQGETEVIVVFDSQAPNFRTGIDEGYKGNRVTDYSGYEESPYTHYPYIREVLNHLGVYAFESSMYEADDMIASICIKRVSAGCSVLIASNDSDFYQLLYDDKISILRFKKGGKDEIYSYEEFADDYGITPERYVLWKSLVGDRTDNIKGIHGIGPKRATLIVNGQMEFDYDEDPVVSRNVSLIALLDDLEFQVSWQEFNSEALSQPNQLIFKELGWI